VGPEQPPRAGTLNTAAPRSPPKLRYELARDEATGAGRGLEASKLKDAFR